MAAGRPASAVTEKAGMVHVADKNDSARGLLLRVALEAKVGVTLQEHFGVDGTVWVVADSAAFAERGVLENKRAGLFTMALGAGFVLARHGQSARRFHNVHSVGIVTLHAVHFSLDDWMMLWEVKFSPSFLMALETGFGAFAGVDDEFFGPAAASHGDVFAAGPVTRFAAALPGHFGIGNAQARVRAARERAGDMGMTIKARLVAHVGRAFDL